MRILKLNHERCGEWDDATYLFVPSNKSLEEVYEDVNWARKQVIENGHMSLGSRPTPLSNYLEAFKEDSISIAEAKRQVKKRAQEINDFDEAQWKKNRSFTSYMQERGYKTIHEMDENELIVTDVDWGHSHGVTITY